MHIISKKRLREFWDKHPRAKCPLSAWYKVVDASNWESIAEVRKTYPHADQVGKFTVFNIGGNKFRLVVVVRYKYGKVYIRRVMTHAEYDKNDWKEE
ncbi:mRNA interferase HigB [Pseudobythopirellula maris]|uniref:mRNA interferase HigB n=1 Tax=Pseudobythopirellula maris TaxID=2527991 RepID=A0A5C5ZUB8_9BACT|nr:type II toxin-antitoxin system HigB family toxin [Pseudobythopirellula maris]TWT91122.1 mRNA interferase HigB [Pseudobythopirellula maris]